MSRPDLFAGDEPDRPARAGAAVPPPRYGRYVGLLAIMILVLITINTIVTKPNGASGVAPGQALPQFAVPLATSNLKGDADVATHANDGEAGKVPACRERGAEILNVCQQFEHAPLVLALFVDEGSCASVLASMQSLGADFPGVRFAAVSIRGSRTQLRRLIASRRLSFPLGIDEEGTLAALYKVASCPQVTFALPGGIADGKALLTTPSESTLRRRTQQLVAAAQARGWKGAA
jgi:hypothetical protein